MGYTLEDAWQDEAYDRMVDEILASHKDQIIDEVLASHKDQIIDEFIAKRMASYFVANPTLSGIAQSRLDEAKTLLELNASASLIFSASAIEITIKDLLLKPIAIGMVHDDPASELLAELVVSNRNAHKLLFHALVQYGLDIDKRKRIGKDVTLWMEIKNIRGVRNKILHDCDSTSKDMAKDAIDVADIMINKIFPYIRSKIIDPEQ
jgi:hypothetical protein